MTRLTDQRGQVALLVVGMALVCFAVAGLAVDGTRAFLLRRTLQNAADSAALAGAARLDLDLYYESGGTAVELDPAAARAAAQAWLARRGIDATGAVVADARSVYVVLRGRVRTTFLAVVGVGRIPVAVEARAEPLAGEP